MPGSCTAQAAYGGSVLELPLPPQVQTLVPVEPQPAVTPELFLQHLYRVLEEHPLDLSRPCLVVADKTRRCDYPTYLPLLLQAIRRFQKRPREVPVFIAYGTHPAQTDRESLDAYGPEYREMALIHHDCHDRSRFKHLGTTRAGTPVRVRRELAEASAIVTMGPICHHYFAGYGGGRKLVFPGCGEQQAIYHNHGLFLDRTLHQLAPGCGPGMLAGNPVARDLFDFESFLPASLAIHGLQDSRGRICDFLIGRGHTLFLEACARHGHHYEVTAPQHQVVVASCGGFPKDVNFIQAHKTMHNSAAFVRDGGLLIVLAQCPDGIGSRTFLPWFGPGGFDEAFARLSQSYQGNGGTALALMTKTARISIAMVTDLDQSICDTLGVMKWNPEQLSSHLQSVRGSIAWIANGSLLVKRPSEPGSSGEIPGSEPDPTPCKSTGNSI